MTLSDDDWRAIQALKLNLPDEARSKIDGWIDLEVRVRLSRQKPAVTRAKLKQLHAIAARLSCELGEIDGNTMAALVDTGSPVPPRTADQYSQKSALLTTFIQGAPQNIDWQAIDKE